MKSGRLGIWVQERVGNSIDGSVVECSPATRAARVRFPVDALICSLHGLGWSFLYCDSCRAVLDTNVRQANKQCSTGFVFQFLQQACRLDWTPNTVLVQSLLALCIVGKTRRCHAISRFLRVVVITSTQHAEGPRSWVATAVHLQFVFLVSCKKNDIFKTWISLIWPPIWTNHIYWT